MEFFSSSADRALDEANNNVERAKAAFGNTPSSPTFPSMDSARPKADVGTMITGNAFRVRPPAPAQIDGSLVDDFANAAVTHQVPADALMAMAERDSGFDQFSRSRGPGEKKRGIIKLSDRDVAENKGVNPYITSNAIDVAARKMSGYLQSGLSVPDAIKATKFGPDKGQWGPEAEEYANGVLSRSQHFADTYFPAPEPQPAPAPAPPPPATFGDNMRDAALNLALGVNSAVGDMNELTHKLMPKFAADFVDWADKSVGGKTLEERNKEISDHLMEKLSPQIRSASQKKWWDGDKGALGDAWGDWRAYAGPLLQSLPETVLSSGPAMRLAQVSFASAIAKGVPAAEAMARAATVATVGGAVTEGALGGAQSSREVRDEIEKLPFETLKQSDAFNALKQTGMSDEAARQALARDFGTRAFITGGLATGLFGGMGDRVIAKTFLENIGKGGGAKALAANLAKSAAGEGLAEELPQSALQQLAQNEAVQKADPNKSITDDVVNQALVGAVTGAAMGAGMGGAFHGATRNMDATPPEPPRDPSAMGYEPPPPGSVSAAAMAENGPLMLNQPGEASAEAMRRDFGPGAVAGRNTPPQMLEWPGTVSADAMQRDFGPGAESARAMRQLTGGGPLARILEERAPDVAAAADVVGKHVVVSDEAGNHAGTIIGQDADGVLFKGDDGQEQLVSHEEISTGQTKIAEAPKSATGLDEAGSDMGKAVVGNLYDGLFKALQDGKSTFAGVKDPLLARAKPSFDAGLIKSPDDLQSFANGDPAFKSPEPRKPSEPSITDEAIAKSPTKPAPRGPERSVAEMSEPELRERLKFIAGQAKAAKGWTKPLMVERRKIEAEIDARGAQAAKPAETDTAHEDWWERNLTGAGRRQAAERAGVQIPNDKVRWQYLSPEKQKALGALVGTERDPSKSAEEAPAPVTDDKRAKAVEYAKRNWWGARPAAEAFIENNGLGDTHEVKQEGRKFSAVPKAETGFVQFDKDSGTLGVPRAEMPQVATEHHGALTNFLNAKGIDHETKEVPADELKPTQAKAPTAKKLSSKEKAAAERARVESYFTPGNIVKSYGGGFDRVISFDWNNGDVRATVESARKEGDKWVAEDRPRTHSTIPDRNDKVVERVAVEPAEKPLGSDNTRDVSEGADAPGSHQGGDAKASLRVWMPDASEINLFHWNDPGNGGMNAEALRNHIIRGKDGPLIQKLIISGRVVLHDTADALPGEAPENVQGMTAPDGIIHLVAGNLTPETARAVLLHEAFHAGAEALTGTRGWKSLMERVQTAVDNAQERGEDEGFWADAIEQARVTGGLMAEEVSAYTIENYERAPAGVKDIADKVIGLVKAWAVRTFRRQFGSVTPAQLRALAVTALRSSANADGVKGVGSSGVRYSIASSRDIAATAGGLFDESRHALSDIITDLMTGKKSPSTSILGAVPVRPLFLELAKHLPSARLYLDTKQAMDAMRNKYARETDETLQRWFKFANKIARDGAKIYRRNVAENTALMDLMHESTIAQADPSKDWAGQENMTPADRDDMRRFRSGSERYGAALTKEREDAARKAAWSDLKVRYDALSNEAKAIYVEVRESYKAMADRTDELVIQNVKQAAEAALTRAKRDHADAMTRIADDGLAGKERHDAVAAADRKLALAQTTGRRASAARIKRMREMFESNRLKGPYFPLARFGNYFVTVRDNGGKVISFSRFESVSDQKRFAKEQEAIAGQSVELGLVKKENEFKKIVDPTFMAKLDALFDDHGVGHEVRDQVWQRYLESLPDLSMRKHRIHRKNRAGFNNDALRAFAHTMFHGGHQLARLEYGIELQEHMDNIAEEVRASDDPVRSGAVYEEMKRAHDFTMNPQGEPWAYRLTSFAFLWTMAFNVSSALVNTEQTWSKGLGNLAFDIDTKAGRKEAFSQLARATKEFFIGKGFIENASTLTDEERAAVAKGYELGVIDKTQAHDLASMVETGVSYNPLWNYMMKAASAPMHHTERFNREVTFLAAYRIARDKGLSQEQAIKKASDLTWMTHYDNQSSSKSRMMRGDVARVVFALKSYQANVLFRLFYDIHQSMHAKTADERKMAIGRTTTMLAMSLPIAGLSGAFGFHTLMTIAGFFMGLAGNDDDPEEELRRIMLQMAGDSIIGRAVGGMIMDGAPGYITGTALSDRIGNADLWFRSNNMEMNPEQKWEYLLEQLGGATFGLAHQIYQGGVDVANGNVERGLEKMAPAFIKNPAKAVRYAMEGLQDKNENPIVEYVPWQDIMKQAAGFTPAEIRERMDRNTFQRNTQTRIHGEKSAALRAAGRARMMGDQDAIEAAQKKVDAYNAEVPEARITPKSIMQEAKRFKKKHDRMEFGVDLDPKLEDRIKEQTSPSIYAR